MHNEGKHRKQHLSKNAADVEQDSIIQFAELQVELDDEEEADFEGAQDEVRSKAKTFIKKSGEARDPKLGALLSRGKGTSMRKSMVCFHEDANQSTKSLRHGDTLLTKDTAQKRRTLLLRTPKH